MGNFKNPSPACGPESFYSHDTFSYQSLKSFLTLSTGPAQAAAGGQRALGQEGGPAQGAGALRLQGHPERQLTKVARSGGARESG